MFEHERCTLEKMNKFNLTIVDYNMCLETQKKCNTNILCNKNKTNDLLYSPICATNSKKYF